jgi:hypothetical protein
LVSTREAFALLRIGKTKGFSLIHSGRLRAIRLDGKLLVDLRSIDDFLNSLPSAQG